MKTKKIIVSVFLIMAIAITVATPILARSNIILIRDTYYYTENGTYITSECATSAGEAEHHYVLQVLFPMYTELQQIMDQLNHLVLT